MQKFQELLNNQSLSETLMADEKFVSEAKETLAKEGKAIDDTQLKELLDKLEKDIADKIELNELELSEVSGGAGGNTKKKPCENLSKPAKLVIKGVIRFHVSVFCALAGATVGATGGGMVANPHTDAVKNLIELEKLTKSQLIGAGAGTVVGLGGGMFGGRKLSKLICDKLGL